MGAEAPVNGVCVFGGHHDGYPRSGVILEGLRRLGIPVSRCVVPHRWKSPRRYPALAFQYLRMQRPFDVVYVPEFRHKDVALGAALAAMTGRTCVFDPLVSRYDTRVHDRADAREASAQAWHNRGIDRFSFSLPDLVLADTRAHSHYYRRELAAPGTRVRVLEVGYDDTQFRFVPETPVPADHATVLFYGSYLPLHGVPVIVEAATLLRERAGIEFVLVGGGQTYPDVARRVRERGLGNVTLVPRLPPEELPGRIAAAHVCLGIFGDTAKAARVVPNKVYQCMGVGRAVVGADTPAMRESFCDGEDVVLTPAGDAAALAHAIVELVAHPARRAAIGARAHEHVARDFSPVALARRFAAYCDEVST